MMHTWTTLRAERVLYEDDTVLVINKPSGLAVLGNGREPDLVTLAREFGEKILPAHRIDKETSGAILFAKTSQAHASLARQFSRRTIEKLYLLIAQGRDIPSQGTIELPLSVGRKNRVRVAAQRSSILRDTKSDYWSVDEAALLPAGKIYPAITTFGKAWETGDSALVVARPLTGRRHQLRVHFAWIGYPIVGDPLFATHADRMFLHSWYIGFEADWLGDKHIEIEALPDSDFWGGLGFVRPFGQEPALLQAARYVATSLRR